MRRALPLSPGDAPERRRIGPVTATDIVRFAGAGGDFNPLHHDEAAARAAGFAGVIAMGQFSAGIVAGFLTDWVGIENLRSLEVRFVAPVQVGDTLEISASVHEVHDATARVVLTATVGETAVATASAEVSRISQP